MAKKKGPTWNFFKVKTKGVVCKFCSEEYKHANVNKMTRHIKNCLECPAGIKKILDRRNVLISLGNITPTSNNESVKEVTKLDVSGPSRRGCLRSSKISNLEISHPSSSAFVQEESQTSVDSQTNVSICRFVFKNCSDNAIIQYRTVLFCRQYFLILRNCYLRLSFSYFFFFIYMRILRNYESFIV